MCLHLILRACVFMCGGAHVHFSRQLAVSSPLLSLLHLSEYSASCLSSDAHIVVTDNNVKRAYIYIITSDYFLTPAERGFKKCKVIRQMVYVTLQSYSLNMQKIMHTDYR